MTFIFFVFNPLERFRVAFSFLWGGEHVFVHFFTASKSGGVLFKKTGGVGFKGAFEGGLKGGA